MTRASRLKKDPGSFQRLTGITPEKFDEILRQLIPVYETWNTKRLTRPKRQRKIGGGRPFDLKLEDRLLMLLLYYRTYVTHVFLGFLFTIDDSNVGRNINPLQPLLAGIFRIPERRIELSEDEIVKLFFDGTEQPTDRPKKGQRKWYSGKKKRKVRIAAVSKAFCGRTHDKKMYEQTRTTCPPGAERHGDLGYKGTSLKIPTKKPRGGTLTERQKSANHSHSSQRIVVEHEIRKMKIWRICRDQYRNLRSMHTVMFKNIAGLHNMMFA